MYKLILPIIFLVTICPSRFVYAQDLPSWPQDGPPVLFEIEGLGNGYSSPAITDKQLFITGETDSLGYLYAYDLKGSLLWKVNYGREFTAAYRGTRSKPVVVDQYVYVSSGNAELFCFEAKTGNKVWSVDMIKDFEGVNPSFGYSLPPVIDGEMLYCSPGGQTNNIIALNRITGKLVWASPGKGETAGYGSPLVVSLGNRKVLVTGSEMNILALDAGTGELLWNYELDFKGDVPCNTPVFDGTNIYWIAGANNGAVAAKPSPDGSQIGIVWKNIEFDTSFGNFVQIGNYLYGSADRLRKYVSVDAQTGTILNSVPFGIGSLIQADNILIAYNQKGQVGLIRPDGEKLELVSSFKITKGTYEHFSHPVYTNGKLFIRHGDVLLAFNLKNNEKN